MAQPAASPKNDLARFWQDFRPGPAAWIAFAFSLLLTAVAWQTSRNTVEQSAADRFELQARELTAAIESRMLGYELLLRSGVGLFHASSRVDRNEWRTFVNDLELQRSFPGIQGIGYAEMIAPARKSAHEAEIRAEGFSEYAIHPAGERENYSAIIYLEPFDWRNQRAFGYDMYAEPTRREAMEIARDTGKAAISGRVVLIQETDQDVQYGFVMYMPLFREGAPIKTLDQRRAALQGYVYAPFRMKDLMQGILATNNLRLDYEIYDSGTPTRDNILLSATLAAPLFKDPNHHPQFGDLYPVTIGGRTWSVYVYSKTDYFTTLEKYQPGLIAAIGMLLNLLLFGIITVFSSQKNQAQALAQNISTELATSEERQRMLFSNAKAIMLLSHATSGRIIDANKAAQEFYGMSLQALQSLRIEDLCILSPEEMPEIPVSDDPGDDRYQVLPHRLANGAVRQVEIRSGRIDIGSEPMMYSIVFDVTERQQAEAALHESEKRYHDIFELTPVPLWIYDAQSLRFLEVNNAAIQQYGYSHLEFLTMSKRDILLKEDFPLLTEYFADPRSGNTAKEMRHLKKNGEVVTVETKSKLISYGGKTARIAVAVDISDRARAARALREAMEAAEAANKAKSDFVANMSHEIRTPMNAILGFTQLLLDMPLEKKVRKYLNTVHHSSKALLGLLNDILDYSKIEAQQVVLESRPFSLVESLERIADLFVVKAEEKGIEMFVDISPEVPNALIGDNLRLTQVLNNLVGNAVKFTEQGTITLSVHAESVTETRAKLKFVVQDTGIGMAPAQIDNLFKAFQQADVSITRKYGGTGLGLVICKRLVNLMGGDISVHSQLNEGSTFAFSIDFERDLHARNNVRAETLSGGRVLVVDDQPDACLILQELLEQWSFKVDTEFSGEAALKRIFDADQQRMAYDLILLDWKMPKMDGLALYRNLREAERTRQLDHAPTVIMVSAYDQDRLLREAVDSMPNAILTKPVTSSRLMDCLANLNQISIIRQPVNNAPGNLPWYLRGDALQGNRILLAEDNLTNQEVAVELLAKLKISVTIANHGAEAVALMQNESFDLILMDMQMPVMSGAEATRKIRETDAGKDIPIIAFTAAAMTNDRLAALESGMNDHLAKPIDPDELVTMLLKWLPLQKDQLHHPSLDRHNHAYPVTTLDDDSLDGFDRAQVFKLFGHDMDKFTHILTTFYREMKGIDSDLKAAVENVQWDAAIEITHRLRGAAGNIGAIALQQASARLEEELALNAADSMNIVEMELDKVMATCTRLQPTATADKAMDSDSLLDHSRFEDLLNELGALVDEQRLVPLELLSILEETYPTNIDRQHLENLSDAISGFQYEKARQALSDIVRSVNKR